MKRICLFIQALALAAAAAHASEGNVAAPAVQGIANVIHVDSNELNLDLGGSSYRLSLSRLSDKDYKVVGLVRPADEAGYSAFMYCALRKIALERGFEYWLLLPSRSSNPGYVGYMSTETEARYVAEKSIHRLKIHSVHRPPAHTGACLQSAQAR